MDENALHLFRNKIWQHEKKWRLFLLLINVSCKNIKESCIRCNYINVNVLSCTSSNIIHN
jgi:hypothetical protein